MTLNNTRKPLKIYQDDQNTVSKSTATSGRDQTGHLGAKTRSMTRLSSIESSTTVQTKLRRINKVTGKAADKENSRPIGSLQTGRKRTLQEKMLNVQKMSEYGTDGDGLKRKANIDGGFITKKQKIGQTQLSSLPINNAERGPVTPTKAEHRVMVVQPTPAREILAKKIENDIDSDEDEDSPEISSRFIARPPTPPRPHISLRTQTNKVDNDEMEVDSPERPIVSGQDNITTKPTKTPSRSLISRILAPVTPGNTATTPKRVMGSISKFRAGPSSVKRPTTTPFISPNAERPMLASLLDSTEEVEETEMVKQEVEPAKLVHSRVVGPLDRYLRTENVTETKPVEEEAAVSLTTDIEMDSSEIPVEDTAQRPEPVPARLEVSTQIMPSRLPRSVMGPPRVPQDSTSAAVERPIRSSIPVLSKAASSTSGLGRGLPSSSAATTSSNTAETAPTRRKPSYPSTLGSGPLVRPRDRMVSGPTLFTQKDGTLAAKKDESLAPKRQSPRSVSEPSARPRPSLSTSTSRREGLSSETSKSLAGLADALKTLRMKKPEESKLSERPRPRSTLFETPSQPLAVQTTQMTPASLPSLGSSSSSRLSSIHRPRHSVIAPPAGDESMSSEEGEQAGDKSLAAIMSSTNGEGCLKGVVAFVDVKTADGDDASPIFSDMLRALGAKVLSRLTDNVTHIVYKSGKPTTLSWYRKQEEEDRPHIVGISWVTRSKEKGERLDEEQFAVKVAEEDIFQKRRKSMEPKALMQSTLSVNCGATATSISLASVRRQSMMYAPKISSPLKKAFRSRDDDD